MPSVTASRSFLVLPRRYPPPTASATRAAAITSPLPILGTHRLDTRDRESVPKECTPSHVVVPELRSPQSTYASRVRPDELPARRPGSAGGRDHGGSDHAGRGIPTIHGRAGCATNWSRQVSGSPPTHVRMIRRPARQNITA